jgi:Uma2 family endonuclease
MSTADVSKPKEAVIYPESDGLPMAENSKQFYYIKLISSGLEVLYADRDDVYVIGDLLWYPVEGDNTTRQAPDTMVIFGRHKGHRGSYLQWEEGGIAPQVVFEILSPGNRAGEMKRKFEFYQRYGVEEYYVYDPDNGSLQGYVREGDELVEQLPMQGWISPRMGVKFQLYGNELALYRPDGSPFRTAAEEHLHARQLREQAERERQRADQEKQRADQEKQRAEQERQLTEQERAHKELALRKAEEEARRAEEERVEKERALQELARLRARLKELGHDGEA